MRGDRHCLFLRTDWIPEMTQPDPAAFALQQFFGSYFHQDWVDDAADSHEVVASFLAESRPAADRLTELAAGIDRLVSVYSDAELHDVLYQLGSYFLPIPPKAYSSWLRGIAAQFRDAATD
jgi:contact-dependent growth inhibition (CDI) system CdiI-like immunity protein